MKLLLKTGLAFFALSSLAFAEAEKKDIVDTAVAAEGFTTLVAAVKAAGLVDALKGEGPLTVFAPTDEAFKKLPAGTVEDLLKPENKDKLVDILTYHVVAAKVPAATAVTLTEAEMLNKKKVKVAKKEEGLFLNESKVIKTDIMCSNGVIHVIDSVLLPPADKSGASVQNHLPMMMINNAIESGVMLFNRGNHEGCAAVYEIAASSLLEMPAGTLTCGQKRALQTALAKADHSRCMTAKSWTLRMGLDSTLAMSMN